jgi:hypothetical protein
MATKVILTSPLKMPAALPRFVQQCLLEGIELIAVVGTGCEQVEEDVDWCIVGDGSGEQPHLATTAHPDETFEEVLEFVTGYGDGTGEVRVIQL